LLLLFCMLGFLLFFVCVFFVVFVVAFFCRSAKLQSYV
jgi:hypothetical protein